MKGMLCQFTKHVRRGARELLCAVQGEPAIHYSNYQSCTVEVLQTIYMLTANLGISVRIFNRTATGVMRLNDQSVSVILQTSPSPKGRNLPTW